MKEKYIKTYGVKYQLNSPNNNELMQLFHQTCQANGIVHDNNQIFDYLKKYENKHENIQLSLFDDIE